MQQVAHYVKMEESDIKNASGTVKSESLSDRDAGFCSGEETDLDTEYHSPTDNSNDSMDTKVFSDSCSPENKRKSEESRESDESENVPEMKKIKLENCSDRASPCSVLSESVAPCIKEEKIENLNRHFRPWDKNRPCSRQYSFIPSPSDCYVPAYFVHLPAYLNCTPARAYAYPNHVQEEPLALVVDKKKIREESPPCHRAAHLSPDPSLCSPKLMTDQPEDLTVNQRPQEVVRIPERKCKAQSSALNQQESTSLRLGNATSVIVSPREKRESSQSGACGIGTDSNDDGEGSSGGSLSQQRNYKNMTRERRIEANARERTRVHTISAAFETLRNCIPAYANNQKLSKLSVLRIACSYIMTLSRIAGYDYSIDQSAPSLAECIDNVCSTIQLEGKTRKKKDD